jgi:hypothetical protein
MILGILALCALSCDDLKNPAPAANDPVPPPPPSQYKIKGHWEAESSQGRRIAFDVDENGKISNGRINLHHDCNTGRWKATFDGFEGQVTDDVFITNMEWHAHDGNVLRRGRVTISGRFESNRLVRGGFIDSVNDSRFEDQQPTGEICPTIQGTFEGEKGR